MGQLYTVFIKLDFDDKKAVNEALDKFFDEEPAFDKANKACFEDDLYWRLRVLTCNNQDLDTTYWEHLGIAQFTGIFHATYSWETVLYDAWNAIKPTLNVGSFIQVYPDNGAWTLRVDEEMDGTANE